MLLTLTTTHEPATDLGYLLVKHPDRVQTFEIPTGQAHVCYPEATAQRCTAALVLEVDLLRLASGRGRRDRAGAPAMPEGFTLAQYVNDRPYAASSLLAAALNKIFRSAMRGDSRDRPDLATTAIPLEVRIPVLRCRGGAVMAERLFAPLEWTVAAVAIALDETRPEWGDSRYVDLTLTGRLTVADALSHLYVLLPVLDDAKHYWVSPDEVDKLLRAGAGWLANHPEKETIALRYLAHRRALAHEAMQRLSVLAHADDAPDPDSVDESADLAAVTDEEADLPAAARRVPLAEQRRRAVLEAISEAAPTRVLDLGCGGGALLADLLKMKSLTAIAGVDISSTALQMAERRLRLNRLPQRQRDRITLWQSALTYSDDRLVGFDAAVLMEVIEHVDPPRLPALVGSVFGHARPSTVVLTTPNVEYNSRYETMTEGSLRHRDHRFEWTRAEFAAWCEDVGRTHGYAVRVRGVGDVDPDVGAPTQLAVFTIQAAA